jgi:aspartate/glutamate racemase
VSLWPAACPHWQAGDYTTVRATLAVSLRRLAAAGADFFACPDNTAHLALEQPGPSLPLPGLHIAEMVAGQAARDGRQRVGVLGTSHTMTGPVYPQALAARHMATEIPGEHDRAILDEIIMSELVNGVFTGTARQECTRIIERLAARGCDAVALACTDTSVRIQASRTLRSTVSITSSIFPESACLARLRVNPFTV